MPLVNIAHPGFMKRKRNCDLFWVFRFHIGPMTETPAMPNTAVLWD